MNPDRLLQTFCDLVRIDSPSRSESQVAAYCIDRFKALGCDVRVDDSAVCTGSDTGNVIAHLRGSLPGRVFLSAHMDCVEPCRGVDPVIRDGAVYSAGDTVLGSDDKAGIAAIIEALQSVRESGSDHPDVTVVLTTCEEVGLLGAAALDASLIPGDVAYYVLDAGGAPGTVVIRSPRHYDIDATFRGKAAHAGAAPEEGVSAIQMAASAIASMDLGRLDAETTANVGVISGGSAANVVPDECSIRGECRSLDADRADEVRDAMLAAFQQAAARFGGSVEVSYTRDYELTNFTEDDSIVWQAAQAARAAGLEPHLCSSGGGSDANALAAKGVNAITLGIGMAAYHSTDEHISLADLEGTALLAEKLVTQPQR